MLAVRAYWLAADAPPMGAAVPLLMAAGPPAPAVPAVSFEPERLHPTVPPASAAINTAVITFLSTGSIIISSRIGRLARFIVGKKAQPLRQKRAGVGHCKRERKRTWPRSACVRNTVIKHDRLLPRYNLQSHVKNGQRSSGMRVAATIGFTARSPAHARTGRHIA
jgi:hypothetical protein